MIIEKELEKCRANIIIEIIEYIPYALVSRMRIKKTTGNITASSMAIVEELEEKTSPFDINVQIIDGSTEVNINDKTSFVKLGEGLVFQRIPNIVS